MNVLIMSESCQAALACIQSFGRRGHRVSVLHSSVLSPHAFSSFVHKRFLFESKADLRAVRADRLLQLLLAESIDLVIPISDEDAHVLAECAIKAPEQRGIVCPSLAAIEIARDRSKTEVFCSKNGIRIPDSIQIAGLDDLRRAAATLGYPVVVKESYSVASQGVKIIDNELALAGLEELFSEGKTLQVQRFIEGDFVGVTGFGFGGELKGSFSFRVAYEFSHGGTPPYAISEETGAGANILTDIVKSLSWSGGIDLDLLRDRSGELYLLEMNPRFSGTTVFPLKLGMDLPRLYEAALDNSFDRLPATPPLSSPVLFISYQEEVELLSRWPQVNVPKSVELRKRFKYVESLFLDDVGLTRNQFVQFLRTAWFTSRSPI